MFREVRRRLLPAAARDLYLEAKANFDGKALRSVGHAVSRADRRARRQRHGRTRRGLSDLRLLGEGFLKLADAEVVASKRAAEQAVAAAAVRQQAAPRPPAIFADDDARCPRRWNSQRRMPAWNPPAAIARIEYRGVARSRHQRTAAWSKARCSASRWRPAYDPSLMRRREVWRFQACHAQRRPREIPQIVRNHPLATLTPLTPAS